jgi:hypothetical protein
MAKKLGKLECLWVRFDLGSRVGPASASQCAILALRFINPNHKTPEFLLLMR